MIPRARAETLSVVAPTQSLLGKQSRASAGRAWQAGVKAWMSFQPWGPVPGARSVPEDNYTRSRTLGQTQTSRMAPTRMKQKLPFLF